MAPIDCLDAQMSRKMDALTDRSFENTMAMVMEKIARTVEQGGSLADELARPLLQLIADDEVGPVEMAGIVAALVYSVPRSGHAGDPPSAAEVRRRIMGDWRGGASRCKQSLNRKDAPEGLAAP